MNLAHAHGYWTNLKAVCALPIPLWVFPALNPQNLSILFSTPSSSVMLSYHNVAMFAFCLLAWVSPLVHFSTYDTTPSSSIQITEDKGTEGLVPGCCSQKQERSTQGRNAWSTPRQHGPEVSGGKKSHSHSETWDPGCHAISLLPKLSCHSN